MFCSSCGAAVTPELNYCKRCGNELGGAVKKSDSLTEAMVLSIVGVTVGGIGVIIGLMAVMKNVIGFDNELIFIATLLSFFLVLVADVALIMLLLTRSRAGKKLSKKARLKEAEAQRLYEAPARELAEPMPIPTITEHTTRSLEPVLREPRKKSEN